METRFRKFITSRRQKIDSQTTQTDRKGSLQRAPPPQWPLPASIPQHLSTKSGGKTLMAKQDDRLLQAVPYDVVTPGKRPTFSSQPVKGNGPVKLQASRRSATGELLATTQDSRTTLESIKEGDYIVGRKYPRDLRNRPTRHVTPIATPALSTTHTSSDLSISPRTPPEMPASPWSLSLSEPVSIVDNQSDGFHSNGLGLLSTPTSPLQIEACELGPSALDLHSGIRSSCVSSSTSPSVRRIDEQNPTIAALWKAEQNRLVEMYGCIGVSGRTPDSSTEIHRVVNSPDPLKSSGRPLHHLLDSLPCPISERISVQARPSSNMSATSSSCHDDTSDTCSNKRVSLISSCAESSSITIHSTATDPDAVVTRDDIRRIVEDMRSTYLRALEVHPPSLPKPNHSARKKRRPKPGTYSTAPPPTRSNMSTTERQTWHGNDGQRRETASKRSSNARAASHPVAGFGRLSPVEASPPRETRPTNRLQRADSATLGSIMSKIGQDSESDATSKDMISTQLLPQTNTTTHANHNDAADKMVLRHATQRVTCIENRANVQSFILQPEGNFF